MVANDVNFEPYGNNVLLEEIKEGTTEGGLVLPEGTRAKDTLMSVVRAVGPGAHDLHGNVIKPRVQVGDVVYQVSGKMMPLPVTIDGRDYFLLPESSLLGKRKH